MIRLRKRGKSTNATSHAASERRQDEDEAAGRVVLAKASSARCASSHEEDAGRSGIRKHRGDRLFAAIGAE